MDFVDLPEILSPSEAAAYLRLSRSTVYNLIHEGDLPFHRLRGACRIHRNDLDAFLKRTRVTSIEEDAALEDKRARRASRRKRKNECRT